MEYQVFPYDYYVREYFLAKSLIHVLPYIHDDICFEVAMSEAVSAWKTNRSEILKHVNEIKKLLERRADVISESGSELL